MKVIEEFLLSKTGRREDCEDVIVHNQKHAAVIDGATARTKMAYEGKSAGLKAALLTREVLEDLPADISLENALERLESRFSQFYNDNGLIESYSNRLTASAVLYSPYYHQIWLIGDCQCQVDGQVFKNPNGIDDFIAATRSFINQAEILKGKSEEWVGIHDPGAQVIKKLLVDQFLFQNQPPLRKGAYHYAAIDGRKILADSVRIIQLKSDKQEIILASDGYPILRNTLDESEVALAELLRIDPLCIYINKGVKGLKNGLVSYDDRAYLRLSI